MTVLRSACRGRQLAPSLIVAAGALASLVSGVGPRPAHSAPAASPSASSPAQPLAPPPPARVQSGQAAAPQAAELAPRSGEATFTIFFGASPIGEERVQLTASPDGWIIGSTGRMAAPFDLVIRRFEVRYDRAWRPTGLLLDATRRGEPISLRTSFQGTTATTTVDRPGGAAQAVTAAIAPDAVVLPGNYAAAYEALGVRLAPLAPGAELAVFSPPQSIVTVRLNSVSVDQIQTAGGLVRARRHRVTFLHPANPLDAEVWTDEHHRLLRVSLPAANLDAARAEIVTAAARRRAVRNPGDEDVRIPGNGFTLAGTLTRPAQATDVPAKLKVRWPAVVLVAGERAADRDETVYGIPIYGQLAGLLAARGFLVVRYDKRGTGQSGGRAEAATLDDYADDVRAVVQWLERRDDVDRLRIVVFGHGEGGMAALAAAARDERIRALVLAATPGMSGAELVLAQQAALLARAELADAEREAKVALQKKLIAAVLGMGSWDEIPEPMRRQADTPWFRSFLAFDPASLLKRVRQPILVLHGERDQEISPDNAERLAALANARRNAVVTELRHLAGINHLLVPAERGDVEEYARLIDSAVSPEIADLVASWAKRVLTHGKGD